MSKKFYSEYAQHCMRFYTRHPRSKYFKNFADRINWQSCDRALERFGDQDRRYLMDLYSQRDTLADGVYALSASKGIPQDYLWNLISDLEKRIAKERGLI